MVKGVLRAVVASLDPVTLYAQAVTLCIQAVTLCIQAVTLGIQAVTLGTQARCWRWWTRSYRIGTILECRRSQ